LALLVLGGLVSATAACSPPEHVPVRAVVLISCDTLRADRLGMYGYERDTSPNLDAFAKHGVRFERAYATAPHTNPALSSLLTSRLPDEIGVAGGNRTLMPASIETLPEWLGEAGIESAAIVSNWALRRAGAHQGDVGVSQGFAHFDDDMGSEAGLRAGHFERLADATTDAAIRWLDANAAGEERFFLWVHYQDPHGPYTPPASQLGRYESTPQPGLLPRLGTTQEGFGQIPHYQILEGRREPGWYRDRYDEEIRFFDQEVGRLLRGLDERGVFADSLVIFTADHGESLGEHNYWFTHEANLYDEEVRVPLVVRAPEGVPLASASELVSHLDVAPTVLHALGLPARPARGSSLLTGDLPDDRIVPHSLHPEDSPLRWFAITDARYRLVLPRSGPQLFDYRNDPEELRDLAADEPDRVESMIDRYRAFAAKIPAPPRVEVVELDVDDDTRAALEALGYLPPDEDDEAANDTGDPRP
jgi:arylsulfatase